MFVRKFGKEWWEKINSSTTLKIKVKESKRLVILFYRPEDKDLIYSLISSKPATN